MVMRLGLPSSPAYIYAFILLDSVSSVLPSPPHVGDLVAIRHPIRLRPSTTLSPPAVAVSPANLTRLGQALDIGSCASARCLNFVPFASASLDGGGAGARGTRCELHVLSQVHKSLNKRIELSGASTAPIMVHTRGGTGGGSVRYVKEVIASTAAVATGGRGLVSGGGDATDGGCTYYMREKVLVTHPRAAEAGAKENPRRREAIEVILQKDNSPGAQNLRRVRQLADPTNEHLFDGDSANQQRKRQDDARVLASLGVLSDARKRQREVRENKVAARVTARGLAATKAAKSVVVVAKGSSSTGLTVAENASGGGMIVLSDSSDDDDV